MNPERDLNRFFKRVVGTHIRGQEVEAVSMEIERDPGYKPRYFLKVYFRENPPEHKSPEQDMLQRVFSEIPSHASCRFSSVREMRRVMLGKQEGVWILEDESMKEN